MPRFTTSGIPALPPKARVKLRQTVTVPFAGRRRGIGLQLRLCAVITRVAEAGLLRGVAWNTTGGIVARVGRFLSAIVVARLLGKERFGRFAMVLTTIAALTNWRVSGWESRPRSTCPSIGIPT